MRKPSYLVLAALILGGLIGYSGAQPPGVKNFTPETVEPPLALGPEPKEERERVRWIERICENRLARAIDAADQEGMQAGPVTDFLAIKLASLIRKLIGIAIGLAVTAAIVAFLWANWPWVAGYAVVQTALSWLAGRWGAKK